MVDTARFPNTQRDLQPVAITSVDPASRTATGVTRIRTVVTINCAYATGDTISVPAVGEQWYVERFEREWRLYGRIPFNDATLNIEPEEGQVSVGSLSGPLELNGTQVRVNGKVLRLNGVYYRDDGTTLQRSATGDGGWEPIYANASGGGGTSGVLQLLANKLADIPVTPEVTDYINGLSADELAALTDLADWADSVAIGGSGWLPLCDNPFFTEMLNSGQGDGPLPKLVDGFQKFLNDLYAILFCQYNPTLHGDVTPGSIKGGLQGIQQLFTGQHKVGDFLRGLQDNRGTNATGSLLVDSVQGGIEFLQQLFDFFFCPSPTSALNPVNILNKLDEVFNPLKENPFLQGLADFFAARQQATGNLMHDALLGATEFGNFVTDLLLCRPGAARADIDALRELASNSIFSPAQVVKRIDDFFQKFRDNPFLTGFNNFLDAIGIQPDGHLLINAVEGTTQFFEFVTDFLLCRHDPAKLTSIRNSVSGTAFTPGRFIKNIDDWFQPFRDNPFLTGLQDLLDNNNRSGHLLKDAVAGAVDFVETLFGAINCSPSHTVRLFSLAGNNPVGYGTPVGIFANLKETLQKISANSWIGHLNDIADRRGHTGNLLTRIADSIADLNDFIFDTILGNLFPNLAERLKARIVNFGNASHDPAFLNDFSLRELLHPDNIGSGWFLENVFKPLIKRITGDDGKFQLSDLQDLFDPTHTGNIFKNLAYVIARRDNQGFTSGPLRELFDFFNPDQNDNIFHDLIKAIIERSTTHTNGPFKALAEFFDWDRETLSGSLFGAGRETLLHKIVRTMTDTEVLTGSGPLARLSQLFAGVTITGNKSLLTQLSERVTTIAQTLGLSNIVAAITGVNIDELANSYTLASTGNATGGTFTLSYGGQTTGAITFSETKATTAANIEAALAALSSIDGTQNVTVTVVNTILNEKFTIGIANTDSTLTVASESLTGGTNPGLTLVPKFQGPLAALSAYFNGFSTFDPDSGTNLLQQVLTSTGSNIKTLVSRIIKRGEEFITDPLQAIQDFFHGFGEFNPADGIGGNHLIRQIVQRFHPGAGSLDDLGLFHNNLRGMFGITGSGPLAEFLSGDFLTPGSNNKLADASSRFVHNFLSRAGTGSVTDIAKIPAPIIANLGLHQVSNFVRLITGQEPGSATATGHEGVLKNFFAGLTGVADSRGTLGTGSLISQIANGLMGRNTASSLDDLKAFFGIDNNTGLRDWSTTGGTTMPIITQIVKSITGRSGTFHPLADIASFLGIGGTTDPDTLNPFTGTNSLIKQLAAKIHPEATGLNHLNRFFANVRGLFGISDSDFLATSNFKFGDVGTHFLNNVLSRVGTGSVSILNRLPHGALADNIPALKILGLGGSGTLADDLGNRPVLSALRTWLTTVDNNATEDIHKFFGNFRATLGLHNTNFLSGFDGTAQTNARTGLHDIIANINATLSGTRRWTSHDGVARAILGDPANNGTYSDLTGVGGLFAPLRNTTGTTLFDKLATVLNGGATPLADFFAGLNGGTAGTNSLLHRLISPITGNTGTAQNLQHLGTFFGSINGSSGTLIGRTVEHFTDIIAKGRGMTLADFFSGFNTNSTVPGGLAHRIAQSVGGNDATSLDHVGNFFGNLQTFLGIKNSTASTVTLADFLGSQTDFNNTKFNGFINQFITNVLRRTGVATKLVALEQGATRLADALIPDLAMERITNLVKHLTNGTGTTGDDVGKFFTNLHTFLGGGSGFLSGTFSLGPVAQNFIDNVLRHPTVGTRLVSLGTNSQIDSAIVPDLPINKIQNLISHLTAGVGNTIDDLRNHFLNLKSMFGGTSFLSGSGLFDFGGAANNFVTNVLSKTTTAVGGNVIPSHAIGDFGIHRISNLINYITGATGTAATNPTTVRDFFAGFEPFTGGNHAVGQLTRSIFGTTGTLANLSTFFSGLGGFNPSTGGGTLVHQMVEAATGKTGGALSDLKAFFGIGTAGNLTAYTGTNNFISQLVSRIHPSASTLSDLNLFHTNLRGMFGSANLLNQTLDTATAGRGFIDNVLSKVTAGGSGAKIPSLAIGDMAITQITNLIKHVTGADSTDATALQKFFSGFSGFDPATGSGHLVSQFVSRITGNASAASLNHLNTFHGNLRNFFGANVTNPTTTTTTSDQLAGFFNNINTAAIADSSKLDLNMLAKNLDPEKVNYLLNAVTAGVITTRTPTRTDMENVFLNLRSTLGVSLVNAGTGTFDANAAQRAVHDVIASVNSGLTDSTKRWFTNSQAATKAGIAEVVQRITGVTGATDLGHLTTFFSELGTGYNGTAATGAVAQLVKRITGDTAKYSLADLDTHHTNLRTFLGFNPATTAATTTTERTAAVNAFFNSLNAATPATKLDPARLFQNIGMDKISNLISHLTGGAGSDAASVQTAFNRLHAFLGFNPTTTGTAADQVTNFFNGLNSANPTGTARLHSKLIQDNIGIEKISSLISHLTGSTSGNPTDVQTFFANLRSTFGINWLPGTTFDATAARKAIHDFVASINAGLADAQKWFTTAQANLKANIAEIVQRITGIGGATDLGHVGNFFSGWTAGYNGTPATSALAQLVSRITAAGTTLDDLGTHHTNLRAFLGFNPAATADRTAAVNAFFNQLNGTAPTTKINLNNLASNMAISKVDNLISHLTAGTGGSETDVQNTFLNLRNFLGFTPHTTPDLGTAVTGFFGKLNAANPAGANRLDAKLLQDNLGIDKMPALAPAVTGTAGTNSSHVPTFFSNLRNLLGGVDPLAASSTGVPAQSAKLYDALNAATPATGLNPGKVQSFENVANPGGTLGGDLRNMLNNVVQGLGGSLDTTPTTTQPSTEVYRKAKTTNESITTLSQSVLDLQNAASVKSTSGASDFTDFTDFVPFNNNTGLFYGPSTALGTTAALQSIGTQAVWKSGGLASKWAQGIFTRTKTLTNYQKIGIAFASEPGADANGTNPAYNYIVGRADQLGNEYIFVKFEKNRFSVGYVTGAKTNAPAEVMFAGASNIAHTFTPGAAYYLECGVSTGLLTGENVYRVTRNGQTLLGPFSATPPSFFTASPETHRWTGFKAAATSNGSWANNPGSMAAFTMSDNTPVALVGSGFRRFRGGTQLTIPARSPGSQVDWKFPAGFFDKPDSSTTDYTFTSGSSATDANKITVATTGWYQVTVQVQNTLTGEIAPTLYKNVNTVPIMRGGATRNGTTASATFTVYLQAGDYIQPGYWIPTSTAIGLNTFTGDDAGLTTYISVVFLNRSTTA